MRVERLAMVLVFVLPTWETWAQNSSLMRLPAVSDQEAGAPGSTGNPGRAYPAPAGDFAVVPPRDASRASTRAIEAASLIAVPKLPPRKFKVEDLITIIVRQQKDYKAKGKLDTEKKWDINGKLNEWFRFYPDHKLGTDRLSNGEPGFDFEFDNKFETDGKNERRDRFTTRIQARIIDVKPNGNLVLEARQIEKHDEEEIEITVTGVCRSEDVTADNSILSTQIADLVLVEKNKGALRDANSRGWIPKILDWIKPF
jgi:flagellar L-ring protein precursor FlgH